MKNLYKILPFCVRCALGLFAIASATPMIHASLPNANQSSETPALADNLMPPLMPPDMPSGRYGKKIGNHIKFNGIFYKSGPRILDEIVQFKKQGIDLSNARLMLSLCFDDNFAYNYTQYEIEIWKILIRKKQELDGLQTYVNNLYDIGDNPYIANINKLINNLINNQKSTRSNSDTQSDNISATTHEKQYETFKKDLRTEHDNYQKSLKTQFQIWLTGYRTQTFWLYRSLILLTPLDIGTQLATINQWKQPDSLGIGTDSATHTEVMIVFDILNTLNICYDASSWGDSDKKRIFDALEPIMFSRLPMCQTCCTFLQFLYYVLSHNGDSLISENNEDRYFIYFDGKDEYSNQYNYLCPNFHTLVLGDFLLLEQYQKDFEKLREEYANMNQENSKDKINGLKAETSALCEKIDQWMKEKEITNGLKAKISALRNEIDQRMEASKAQESVQQSPGLNTVRKGTEQSNVGDEGIRVGYEGPGAAGHVGCVGVQQEPPPSTPNGGGVLARRDSKGPVSPPKQSETDNYDTLFPKLA